ncbi:MAG: 4-hydroxybenzoate polyprenyltransferase [bacterium]|jgi:4-hydroxybenzoate polyprenyltransferase
MSIFQRIGKFLELIKFSHTIFALPFALCSLLLATNGRPSWQATLWIILAMVGARTGAMGFNRLIDRKWDAKNPRTANRPSVTGDVSPNLMLVMIVVSFVFLVFASWKLNRLAFYLSPVAIFLVCFYSYTKRFTSWCHIFLGIAIGAAPIAAWIAVKGSVSLVPIILGFSVLTWISGFDVLYALQDYEFDQGADLHSIPAKFGVAKSLWIARSLHFVTVILWGWLLIEAELKLLFLAGVLISGALLLWEHTLVKKDDLSKLNMAFFNMNAVISLTLFFTLISDLFFPLSL